MIVLNELNYYPPCEVVKILKASRYKIFNEDIIVVLDKSRDKVPNYINLELFYYLCEVCGFSVLHHVTEFLVDDIYIIRRTDEKYLIEDALRYNEELSNNIEWEQVLKEI